MFNNANVSHPVWVRGLKRDDTTLVAKTAAVAPRVGAWIETRMLATRKLLQYVAPRVGAWIETYISLVNKAAISGRTPCGCVD